MFIVRDFNLAELVFEDDQKGELFNQYTNTSTTIELGRYSGKQFLQDLQRLETVILKDLKSKSVTLNMPEYSVKVDMSKFKYLGLWTADINADYMCIEPWLSINDIRTAENPFDDKYELEHLNPGEKFSIDYYIEIK